MKLARFFYRTFKGIYDILATYLLLFILPFALAAFGIHLGLEAVAGILEFADLDAMWASASNTLGLDAVWLRAMVALPAHVFLFVVLRRPIRWIQPTAERAFDWLVGIFRRIFANSPGFQAIVEIHFSLTVTLLLVPFVIQPTLVYGFGSSTWGERAVNLLDGTASAALADSVVGLYRKMYADPVVATGVGADAVDQALDSQDVETPTAQAPPIPVGKQPLMDRWDPLIARYAEGDPQKFAMIKAFMYVESAGRQFAVSHTGCAGLMQFCAGTARGKPFKQIFGTGQIYVCGCQTKDCRVPRDVQHDLESGDPEAIERHREAFPCELTDARFNPSKIIHAGSVYVQNLREAYGGNVYLMYIGYNSGPGIASRVWKRLGKNPEATLEEIEVHLADAMRPTYGSSSDARARSLVRTHLPKIKRAYEEYLAAGPRSAEALSATPPSAPQPVPAPPSSKPKASDKTKIGTTPKRARPKPEPDVMVEVQNASRPDAIQVDMGAGQPDLGDSPGTESGLDGGVSRVVGADVGGVGEESPSDAGVREPLAESPGIGD